MIKIDEKLLRCIDGDKKSLEILDNIINRQKEIQEIFKREEKIRDTYKECILKIIEEGFLIIPPIIVIVPWTILAVLLRDNLFVKSIVNNDFIHLIIILSIVIISYVLIYILLNKYDFNDIYFDVSREDIDYVNNVFKEHTIEGYLHYKLLARYKRIVPSGILEPYTVIESFGIINLYKER